MHIRCITFVDCPRQKIFVDVGNIWVEEYDKLAISQRSQHVVLIIPCQALHHRTWTTNNKLPSTLHLTVQTSVAHLGWGMVWRPSLWANHNLVMMVSLNSLILFFHNIKLWTPQSAAITDPPMPQPAALWPSHVSRNQIMVAWMKVHYLNYWAVNSNSCSRFLCSKVRSFGQWAAATCAAPPSVIAGQYATSHCKLLLVMFV